MSVQNLTPEPTDPRLSTAEGVKEAATRISKLAADVVAGMKQMVRDADGAVAAAKVEAAKVEAEVLERKKLVQATEEANARLAEATKGADAAEARLAAAKKALEELRKLTG